MRERREGAGQCPACPTQLFSHVRQFEKVLLKHGWENTPNWRCPFVHRERRLFLSVYVDDIKLAGKKKNLDPIVESTQ